MSGKHDDGQEQALEALAGDVAQSIRAAVQAGQKATTGHSQSHSSDASGMSTHISTPARSKMPSGPSASGRGLREQASHEQTHSESPSGGGGGGKLRSVEGLDHSQTHSESPSGGGGGGKLRSPGAELDHGQTHSESPTASSLRSPLEQRVATALRPILEQELRAAATRRPEHDRSGFDKSPDVRGVKGGKETGTGSQPAHSQTHSEAPARVETQGGPTKVAGPPPADAG